MRMFVFAVPLILVACGAASSLPPITAPDETPAKAVESGPPTSTDRLVAQADKARKEVTSAALSREPPNAYLILVIGLSHNLDEAVELLKEHPSKDNREAVRKAIRALQKVK